MPDRNTPSARTNLRADIRSLFTLRDSPVRWPIALQAAIAIGIPTVGFAIAGEPQLGLLASSGAFTALFLSSSSRRDRVSALPLLALGLIASGAIGVAASASALVGLVALFFVAVVSATFVLGFSIGPPGALFFVLVAGVSSHLAAPVASGGAGIDGWLVVGLLSLGAGIAYLVVLAPLLLPAMRRKDAAAHSLRSARRFALSEIDRVILTRVAVGAGIAAFISAPLGIHRAYWVVLTVVVILQNGHIVRLTILRAVHRVLGTLVGVGVFALLMLAGPSGIWLAILLMALQFGVEVVVIRNYGLALVLITPLALLISAQGGGSTVGATVAERVVDTLLGAAISLGVLGVAFAVRRSARGREGFQAR